MTQTLLQALERGPLNPAIAARLQTMGIVQDWLPGQQLAAEIAKEYAAVSEIAKKMPARKP